MNIKISIIVPIYNVENFLDRCVQSLKSQTYENIEIYLVDDGSPDNCPKMCDQYAKEDSRIRVIHKENGGLSDARNAALDVVTGDYVIFVDSDDYVEKDLCQKLAASVRENCDIYNYRFRRFFNENKGDPFLGSGEVKYYIGRDVFDLYIKRTPFTHMVCDKMFKRELFEGLRFIKGRYAEDLALCYQLFGRAKGAAFIDETFYNYYTRENSIMGSGTLKLCLDTYQGECEAYKYGNKFFSEYKLSNDVRFLNQSMKTYLKLIKRYKVDPKEDKAKMVLKKIERIKKDNLPKSTALFYSLFKCNKSLAWLAFGILKLS